MQDMEVPRKKFQYKNFEIKNEDRGRQQRT